MEHFTKQFTLIDLLGFLFPGAVLSLACQYYYGVLTEPFVRFFGTDSHLLVVYFVALSYLAGILLHEASRLLGCIASGLLTILPPKLKKWFFPPGASHEYYWESSAISDIYASVFKSTPPTTRKEKEEAGRDIFHYVQMMWDPHKLRLFSAFAAMSRAMILTTFLVLCMALPQGVSWCWIIGALIMILLFFSNWMHYQRQRLSYAYNAFLTKSSEEGIDINSNRL